MRKRLSLAVAAVAVTPAPAQAKPAMNGPVSSTAYCLSGRMADGTYVRPGSVAMNVHRLGTKITVSRSPTGRRRFVIRDRIGHGTQLDFWVGSCATARWWGRRAVSYRLGWRSGR